MELRGKTAVVTGASSGLGAAVARDLARCGVQVILLARTATALDAVVNEIKAAGGTAVAYPVDLTDPRAVEQITARILQEVGVPDILVNNAGAGRWRYLDDTPLDEVAAMMAAPYFAAFYVTHGLLPAMRKRGTGYILNVTSAAGYIALPGAAAYTAARWAMRGLHEALRAELVGTGLRCGIFVATKIDTPYFDNNAVTDSQIPGVAKWARTISPQEAAAAIVRGIRHQRSFIVEPLLARFFIFSYRFFPGLVDWLVHITSTARRA